MVSTTASGQITWNVGGDGLWQVDANWDALTQPNASTDDVVILNPLSASTPVVVTLGPGLTRSTGTLTINDTGIPGKHQLIVANSTFLHVAGDTVNAGEIRLASTGVTSRFGVVADLTLSGDGEMILSGAGAIIVDTGGAQNILTHASGHTIRGEGSFGANTLGLINQAGALVSADVNGGTLTIDPGITHGFVNQGVFEAVNGSTLLFTGSGGGTMDNTGGTIRADGAGSEAQFSTGLTFTGGTVTTVNGGVARINTAQNVFWDGGTVDTGSAVVIDNNADFEIINSLTNRGTISLNAVGASSRLGFNNALTLDGGGEIVLGTTGSGTASIFDGNGGAQPVFTNADNTIRGEGNLGSNNLGMVNQAGGLVSADVSGGILTVDPGVTNDFTNQGTFQAVNGGALLFTGNGGGAMDNTGGTIRADGAGSEIQFTNNFSLTDGTVATLNGGVARINAGQNVFWDGVTVDTGSTVIVDNNADLETTNSLTNRGTISLNAVGASSRLGFNNALTLDGGGEIVLGTTGSGTAQIFDGDGGLQPVFTNADNTIRGEGNLGSNNLGMVNQAGGLVSADVSGGILTVDPGVTNNFTNQGTFQAVNGGALLFTGNGGGAMDNTGGTIRADGAGSEIQFTTSLSLTGGTVATTAGGVARINAGQNVFWDGVTVDTGSTVIVDNNSDLEISNSLTNRGAISLTPGANSVRLGINTDTVTIDGGGSINLNDGGTGVASIFDGNGGAQSRLINVDNTISGTGNIGFNNTGFTNRAGGSILANDVAGLTIDPGVAIADGQTGFINEGLVRASAGVTLTLSGSAGGGLENAAGGTIDIDAGSTLELSGTLTHRQGATIDQAGVFNVNSGGNFINEADDYSPGASPGIVNVNGSGRFTNDTNGTVTFEINADGTPGVDFDTIRGTGNFDLAGTLDLDLNFTPNYYESIELILDTSGNNVNGTFEQLGFAPIVAPGDALAITYETNAVLLTRALPGDANLDGFISQGDLDAVLLNWGSTTASWQTGEFTGDDFVSQADLDIVLLSWGDGTPPDFSAIPEPGSLAACGLTALMLTLRRRRA